DGTVECWGYDDDGQIGNGLGEPTVEPTPVVVGGISNAVGITCGGDHTCATLGDGTADCWGDGAQGQLGDGHTSSVSSPSRVVDANGWSADLNRALAAGEYHTCALHATGTVSCWGYNSHGQLGDDSTTSTVNPV